MASTDEHRHGRFAHALAYLALGMLLAGVVPLLIVVQVPDVGRSDAWGLTLIVAVWAGVRLTGVIAVGRPTLFDFFFWLFVYIFMGIAPTVQMRSGMISPTTAGIDVGLDMPTALLVCMGVLCYEAGHGVAWLRGRRRAQTSLPARHSTSVPMTSSPLTSSPLTSVPSTSAPSMSVVSPDPDLVTPVVGVSSRATLILLSAGVLGSAWFIYQVGPGALFGSRDEAFAARSAVWPDPAIRSIMYALAIYPLLVGIGALAQLKRRASRVAASWYTPLLVAATVVLMVVVNPVSSARYSLGTVLFALAVYAGAVATTVRLRVTLMATIGAFIFLFPIADAFRRPEVNLVRDGFFGEYRGNSDYDAFWQIANAYSFVVDGLVQGGQQALGVVFFWVPRALWPDKPVDTGILLANYRGYSFDNLSAPLWAEFLVNGGVPVLICGFLVVGYLLARMDGKLGPAFAVGGFWAIVGAIFPVYMTILLRGSLLQATGVVAVATLCLLIVRDAHAPRTPPGGALRTRPPTAAISAGNSPPASPQSTPY